MALKIKKYEKMIRVNPVDDKNTNIKETINVIRLHELEYLKHLIIVNSLRHIEDPELKNKCNRLTIHWRLFKNNESVFPFAEMSNIEKDKFKKCIEDCINKESSEIIKEKNSIPADLLKSIELRSAMPSTIKNKLTTLLSLLNTFANNRKEIYHSIIKLQDSNYVNNEKAQHLSKQIDLVQQRANELLNNIISKLSNSDNLYESLVTQYKVKEKEYAENLEKFENLKILQDKYNQVDGPQYKALVKRFIQAQEIIKIKREMFNSY